MLPAAARFAIGPAVVLAIAVVAFVAGPKLPASLVGLRTYGPYLAFLLGAGVALWFNRGRALIALLSLLAGYAGYEYALGIGPGSFAVRAVYASVAVLVPLNMLVAVVLPERGVIHHGNYRWVVLIVAEVLVVAWIAAAGRSELSGMTWQRVFDSWLLAAPPLPWLARFGIAAAVAAALVRAWDEPAPLEVGLIGSLAAFFIATVWVRTPGVFAAFMTAAGAVLLVAILQDSHRMAFRDELTGLPSRRALEERLRGLGPVYTIAMVDVDHFKKFNDTHGHDIGDQVLKLVAARLAAVGGGGRAFRYGGEEFTVLFPDMRVEDAVAPLERLRASIAAYPMAVRSADRPEDDSEAAGRRSGREPDKILSVTVSIGVAAPTDKLLLAADVIKEADRALYRAKKDGRNRLSR